MSRLLVLACLAGCGGSSATPPDLSASDFAIVKHDLAGTSGQPCDFLAQTGCLDGLRCVVTANGDVCAPIPDRFIAEGENCAPVLFGDLTSDYCATGLICVQFGDVRKCRKPCFYRKECGANQACVGSTGSTARKDDPVFGEIPLKGCVEYDDCDPITQVGCTSPLRCLFSGFDDQGRVRVCREAEGKSPPGSECTSSLDCAAGVMCASLGFCRQICYLHPEPNATVGVCTMPGLTCRFFFGSGDYGRCE